MKKNEIPKHLPSVLQLAEDECKQPFSMQTCSRMQSNLSADSAEKSLFLNVNLKICTKHFNTLIKSSASIQNKETNFTLQPSY